MAKVTSAHEFGKYVEGQVRDIQELVGKPYPSKTWAKEAGQWIVYGLERSVGFGFATELCSVAEHAWRKGQPIGEAIEKLVQDKIDAAKAKRKAEGK